MNAARRFQPADHEGSAGGGAPGPARPEQKLEIVLKADTSGTAEVVRQSLLQIDVPGIDVRIIGTGVGNVAKSDVLMAVTGSRLVVGFNVEVTPKTLDSLRQQGVEVRLYDVIYHLTEDVRRIAESWMKAETREQVIAKARIIARFERKKGLVIGCEVTSGVLAVGQTFRVITAMGPAYAGKISSLQIEGHNVDKAAAGQQVGLMIADWDRASIGDLVESYRSLPAEKRPWQPEGRVLLPRAKERG